MLRRSRLFRTRGAAKEEEEEKMLGDLIGLCIVVAPFLALLAWREHVDRREHAASLVRADVHAGAMRALGGESVLAIRVMPPTLWRRGAVRVSTPDGWEPVLGQAFPRMLQRVPSGYDVVLHCGGNA
jgi:hypothetical protein